MDNSFKAQMNSVSKAQKDFISAYKRRKNLITFFRIFILFSFLICWELTADYGIINCFIFSSPSRLFKAFISLAKNGEIYTHITTTVLETVICFFLVSFISILIAVLLWQSRFLSDILEPYLVTLNSLPKSALAPVLIVWLGSNIKTIIVAAVSVCIFGTIINIYTSFKETDEEKIKLIYTLGGNKRNALYKVIIPGSVPAIFSSMKVNIGLSLVGVIIGEFLAATKGLGYLIIYGSQVFKMDWVIISIVILCFLAVILYKIINFFEKVLIKKQAYHL